MLFSQFYIGSEVEHSLRLLKLRTGLTYNLLCRLGFCLSLSQPGLPDASLYLDTNVREMNRHTLTGPWESLFLALLRERMAEDGLNAEDLELLKMQFKAHINRGVTMLVVRARSLEDIAQMAAEMRPPDGLPPVPDEEDDDAPDE